VRPEFPGCGPARRTTQALSRRGTAGVRIRARREQDRHDPCVSITGSLVQWRDTIFIRGARTNAHLQELLHSFDMAASCGDRSRPHACLVDAPLSSSLAQQRDALNASILRGAGQRGVLPAVRHRNVGPSLQKLAAGENSLLSLPAVVSE
jgi:hypothetical protein